MSNLDEARRLVDQIINTSTILDGTMPDVEQLARSHQQLDAECERLKKELNFSKNCTGVVVRPTQAMMEAGAKALADYICRKVPGNDNTAACAVYAAMLAAQEEAP